MAEDPPAPDPNAAETAEETASNRQDQIDFLAAQKVAAAEAADDANAYSLSHEASDHENPDALSAAAAKWLVDNPPEPG